MSAELLREAAALMRERADAATPGPWFVATTLDGTSLAVCRQKGLSLVADRPTDPDAAHIASWHPEVAKAVADLLDAFAGDDWSLGVPSLEATHALAVARAYLGGEA